MTRHSGRLAGALTVGAGLALATMSPAFAAPVPDPGAGTAPPGSQGFLTVMGWVKWIALAILVIALMFAGAMMGWGSHRGEGQEHAGRIGRILGGTVIVSAAASILGFLVT